MIKSYTLVRVKPPTDRTVYAKVKELKEVRGVFVTYGEYDLLVEIEVNDLNDLDSFIFSKLRSIEGVESTTTLIEARPYDQKGNPS